LLEVFHGIEFLKIEQFTFKQTEEVFHHSIIQTISFPAHTLNNAIIRKILLVMLVLILLSLIGVQYRSCPEGQLTRRVVKHVQNHRKYRPIRNYIAYKIT